MRSMGGVFEKKYGQNTDETKISIPPFNPTLDGMFRIRKTKF